MSKILYKGSLRYAIGSDGFGNIIETTRGTFGEYLVLLQGRLYAFCETEEQSKEIAQQLTKIGR